MLHKATLIDGDNVIYKMAFLGSIEQANRKEYDKVRLEAAVGKTGFEPATPWSQTRCATGLRYFPILNKNFERRFEC
jgi:hypothetical protein